MSNGITLADIEAALDKMRDNFPLYYVKSKWVEVGNLYHVKAGELNPEYIVFNDDDEKIVRKGIFNRRLVPLSEEPQEEQRARFVKHLEKYLAEHFDVGYFSGVNKSKLEQETP